jgi:putative aldouronate transport system substrate-binding protein
MNRKTVFFVILVVLAISPLFGGGGTDRTSQSSAANATAASAAPGRFPLTETRAELSVLCNKPPYLSDFNENQVTRWLEDYTNVHVTYIHVPSENTRAATNLLIAGGEYPDIMMNAGLTTVDAMNYGSQGILIPINDLISREGYWLPEAVKRVPEISSAIVMPDGNIYGFPNVNQAFHTFYHMKAWINEDWLKKLGLGVPTTTDEFYNVLKAFKTQDPNGNGRADEIPMMGYYASDPRTYPYVFLLNSFVYFVPSSGTNSTPNAYLAMDNGKVIFVGNTEEYREGLRYIARLVNEGLLDPASFTQNINQAKQLGTQPASLIGVFTDFVWWNFVGYNRDTPDRRADYYPALVPLKGPKGLQYTPVTANGFNLDWAHITDHAKDPVLAFRWLDALYNEEITKMTQFGIKGLYWDDPAPGMLGINRKPALHRILKPFPAEGDTGRVTNVFLGNRYSDLRLGEQADWSNPATEFEQEPKLYRETMEKYYPYRPPEGKVLPLVLHHTVQESTEVARLQEQINTYTQENLVAFITGNKNLDRDWAAYVAEFQRLELPRYLQIKQTAYDRQYGKK